MMFDLIEFKKYFKEDISQLQLTEEQIKANYKIYLEDPLQYSAGMLTNDESDLKFWMNNGN